MTPPKKSAKLSAAEAILKKAEAAEWCAREALRSKQDEIEKRQREELDRETASLKKAHQEALVAREQARANRDDVLVEEARSRPKGRLLVGARVRKWERATYFSSKPSLWYGTDRRGIVEVWARDSECPTNLRYSLPKPGDVIVRPYRRDGKLGRSIVQGYRLFEWFPEGVNPNKKSKDKGEGQP